MLYGVYLWDYTARRLTLGNGVVFVRFTMTGGVGLYCGVSL